MFRIILQKWQRKETILTTQKTIMHERTVGCIWRIVHNAIFTLRGDMLIVEEMNILI
jgi:hypothetical protein